MTFLSSCHFLSVRQKKQTCLNFPKSMKYRCLMNTFVFPPLGWLQICLKQGMEMLSIFKSYEAKTSILDDFYYYDDREAKMQERRERQNRLKAQLQPKQVSRNQTSLQHTSLYPDIYEGHS